MNTWNMAAWTALAAGVSMLSGLGCGTSSPSNSPTPEATSAVTFPRYTDAAALRSHMEQVRDGYVAQMRTVDLPVPFVPKVEVKYTPNIVFYSNDQTVVAPVYQDTPAEFRSLLAEWGAGEAAGEELFAALFNWFFLPHELTHYVQETRGVVWDGYRAEQHANDGAVAYLMTTPGGPEKLERLAALLEKVLPRVKTELFKNGFDPLVFALNKRAVDANPIEYGFAQFTMVKSSIARRSQITPREILQQATLGGIDCIAIAPRIAASACAGSPPALDVCIETMSYLSSKNVPSCDSTLERLLGCYRDAKEFKCSSDGRTPPTPPACDQVLAANLECVQSKGVKL